jgi:hypothetical protein
MATADAERERLYAEAPDRATIDRLAERFWREDQQAKHVRAEEKRETVTLRSEVIALRAELSALRRKQASDIRILREAVGDALRMALDENERAFMRYRGVWTEGINYRRGDCATLSGALWIAIEPCAAGARPGKGPSGWRLANKSDQKGAAS